MAQVGDYIGNYRLMEVLNSGTFGQVFRAEHKWLTQRQVAIKFLRLERLNNLKEREQFLHEAQILNQLKHPSILPILDFGLENDVPYIITEYAAGNTLRAYLGKQTRRPQTLATTLHILTPIGEALLYAHDNRIVHRDLKPENILFDTQGKPLLADFGIAIVLATNDSYLGSIGGTAPYMAPEQFKGKAYPESDQYAFGCLLYEMLTGQRPFQAPDIFALGFLHIHEPPTPPNQLNPLIPEHINTTILKAMAKERSERYANMLTLLDALHMQPPGVAPETPTQSLTPSPVQQPSATDTSSTSYKSRQPALDAIPPNVSDTPPSIAAQSKLPFTTLEPPSMPLSINYAHTDQPAGKILSASEALDSQSLSQLPSIGPKALSFSHETRLSLANEPATPEAPLVRKFPGTYANQRSSSPDIPALPLDVPPRRPPSRPISALQIGAPLRKSGASERQDTPTLPPPSGSRRDRNWKRLLFFALLGLLALVVVAGIVISALGGPAGLAALGHLTATVTITPQSKVVQNNYLFSGVTTTPNTNQRQVAARVLTAQSDTRSATANAAGSVPATQATGTLRFINTNATAVTLTSTILTGNDGVEVTFNGPITVPGNPPFIDVNAYAVNPGAAGNIQALDINRLCCFSGITVRNTSAFHGGQDAQHNSVIQQSDIDGATKSLSTQLTASTQAALQKQTQSNERIVDGSFKCNPTTNADHKAGDRATSVTVTVSVTCTEEVFDFAAAQTMASTLLPTNLPGGVDLTSYKLVGVIVTHLVSATVVSGENQVNVNIQAAGKWVYQFSNTAQQQIKQALAKLNKNDALNILRQYVGLSSANINISSGSTMPAITSDITVNIVAVPGLAQGIPTATITPYVPVNGTPLGGS